MSACCRTAAAALLNQAVRLSAVVVSTGLQAVGFGAACLLNSGPLCCHLFSCLQLAVRHTPEAILQSTWQQQLARRRHQAS